jgi:hypothetical protein
MVCGRKRGVELDDKVDVWKIKPAGGNVGAEEDGRVFAGSEGRQGGRSGWLGEGAVEFVEEEGGVEGCRFDYGRVGWFADFFVIVLRFFLLASGEDCEVEVDRVRAGEENYDFGVGSLADEGSR